MNYQAEMDSKYSKINPMRNKIKNNLDVSRQTVFCPTGVATVATSVTHSDWLNVVCFVLKTTVPLVTTD